MLCCCQLLTGAVPQNGDCNFTPGETVCWRRAKLHRRALILMIPATFQTIALFRNGALLLALKAYAMNIVQTPLCDVSHVHDPRVGGSATTVPAIDMDPAVLPSGLCRKLGQGSMLEKKVS
jgi:hypothetical protein